MRPRVAQRDSVVTSATTGRRRATAAGRAADRRVGRAAAAAMERLEGRTLFSTVVVNTTSDTATGAGVVTLSDAVAVADASTAPTTITFSATVFAAAQTITVSPLTLSNTHESVSIQGPAAGLTIDTVGGVLTVNPHATASVAGLTIDAGGDEDGAPPDVVNAGMLTLTDVTFGSYTYGTAVEAIRNTGTLILNQTTIESRGDGNSGIAEGGGIYNAGTCTLNNSQIDSCDAGTGGGIYQAVGTLTLTNSTLSGNETDNGSAAGVYVAGGLFTATNSTLSGCLVSNEVSNPEGLAVYASATATVSLSDVTIDQSSVNGFPITTYVPAAVYVAPGGAFLIANTVIAGTTYEGMRGGSETDLVGYDVAGAVISLGHNFVAAVDGNTGWTSSDAFGTTASPLNPDLSTLGAHGGTTPTEVPASGSPLIDTGSNSLVPAGVTTDQRGLPRISDGTVDIGAVEFQATTFVVNTVSDTATGPGVITFADAVAYADASSAATTIRFDPTVFATPKTIALSVAETSTFTGDTTVVGPAGLTLDGGDGLTLAGSASLTMSDVNVAGSAKAGITATSNTGKLTISDGDVTGNTQAGIEVGDDMTLGLTASTVSDNGDGGIMNSGDATVTGCVITGNTNNSGISSAGILKLTDTTVSDNAGGAYTGGLTLGGTSTLTDDTVSQNTSTSGAGGGISSYGGTTLTNDTIADNATNGSGGGIYDDGSLSLYDVTVADNKLTGSSGEAGGIFVEEGNVLIANSIVARNTIAAGDTDPDVYTNDNPMTDTIGRFDSEGHNLIGVLTGDAAGFTSADHTGTTAAPLNAGLGYLGNNGGPTQTLLPATGSPAIDKGSNSLIPAGVTTDQRGLARISNGTVDIGAVEVQAVVITAAAPAAQSAAAGSAQSFALGSFTEANATAPYTVSVNWGDGTAATTFSAAAAGTIAPQSHTYAAAGADTVSITVTDAAGHKSNTTTFGVTVTAATTIGPRLTGTTYGTAGSYLNDGNTIANATDGNLNTYFNAPSNSGGNVGIDLGSAKAVADIGYAPRATYASRMVGGQFQVSTSMTFSSGVTTVYTVTAAPAYGQLTFVPVSLPTTYRYWRYIGPAGAFCNIAEFELFGPATPTQLTGTTYGTAGSYGNIAADTIAAATDGNLNTFFDAPTASGGNVGIDLGSAKVVTQIKFAPRANFASRMVGGVFQYSTSATFASGVTTVYTITAAPASGVLTTVNISAPAERYWRYLGPANGYCDIAEFQLFG